MPILSQNCRDYNMISKELRVVLDQFEKFIAFNRA